MFIRASQKPSNLIKEYWNDLFYISWKAAMNVWEVGPPPHLPTVYFLSGLGGYPMSGYTEFITYFATNFSGNSQTLGRDYLLVPIFTRISFAWAINTKFRGLPVMDLNFIYKNHISPKWRFNPRITYSISPWHILCASRWKFNILAAGYIHCVHIFSTIFGTFNIKFSTDRNDMISLMIQFLIFKSFPWISFISSFVQLLLFRSPRNLACIFPRSLTRKSQTTRRANWMKGSLLSTKRINKTNWNHHD